MEGDQKIRMKEEKKRAWRLPLMLISIFLMALIIAIPITVYVMTKSVPDLGSAYTFVKFDNGDTYGIWITNAFIVNNPEEEKDISGTVQECNDRSSHSAESVISAIDFDEVHCMDRISELDNEEALNKYKAIILIENWHGRSSSPYPDMVGTQKITKIKSQSKIPILSIRKEDKKYFNDGLRKAKSKDDYYSFGIAFKSLDKLLEINSSTSSPLFEVDCPFNKGKGCLHYFSEPPKNGEYFLGCHGEPKKRALLDIKCKTYNKDCPELQSWEKTLPIQDYEMCAIKEGSLDKENNVYPPLTCRQKSKEYWDMGPGNDLYKISCKDEDNWLVQDDGIICSKEDNFQINHPNCNKHKEVTCRKWGRWSTFSPCTRALLGTKKTRYRFCTEVKSQVKSTERCLILEMEVFSAKDCSRKLKCTKD